MDPIRIERAPLPGIAASVRAGLAAGTVSGLLFGLLDGVVASNLDAFHASPLALLGCLSAAVLQYTLVAMAALAVLGFVFHPLLRGKTGSLRYLVLLRIAIALGLFAEVYWWTRPYVFYGRAAASPERLASTAAMFAASAVAGWFAASALAHAPAALKRSAALLAVAAWIGGAIFLGTQRSSIGNRGEISARNRDLPNVLLVVVDAMRRDVLGCYGNARVKTPNIDRIAADGVVFEDAFTQAPFTWSSFGSILTGKYPRRHGLLHMKAGATMPRENETLPTILKHATRADGTQLEEQDWLEATFHTGTLTSASGLLGGFDMRYEATAGHDLVVLGGAWSTFRSGLLVSILRNKLDQHLELGGTAEEACKWIASYGDRRFFAMVHLYSTHTPYDPREEFRRLYVDPKYDGRFRSFRADDRMDIHAGKIKPSLADESQIRNLYDGGVSEADAEIGTLLDALAKKGIADDTLVIVTADHGESLGEQNLWEHDHMVQTNLRIPLVLRWPKGLQRGARASGLVDEIDIVPTVCDLLHLAPLPPVGAPGGVDGKSALPLVRREVEAVRDYSFAENAAFVAVQDRRWKLVVPQKILAAKSKLEDALKLGPPRPRLYDLAGDPEEKFDKIEKSRDEAERLYAVLLDWNEKLPIPPDAVLLSPLDIEIQRGVLKKFGYIGGPEDDEPPK